MANENFRVKNGLEVGGVLVVNSSGALVANISVGTTTVNATAIGVGSNITINTSAISVGNSTVNAVLTQNSLDIDGTITSGNLNVTGHIIPGANVTYDLGNTTMRWRDLYLSGTTIDIGGALLQTDANSGAIAIIPKPTVAEPNPIATVVSPQGGVVAVPTTAGVPAANAITEAAESNTAAPVPIDVTTVAPANSQILVWSASANVFLPANTLLYLNAIERVTVGANLIANTTALFIGNSTVNAVLTANSLDIDGTVAVGNTTITGDLTVSGNVFFNGGTTNVNSTNLVVEDKNIILGDTDTPTDVTADGGGITLKGTTDKTLTWVDSTDAWTSSEDFNLVSGKQYEINGTQVINSTALGTGITDSSLTSVGTLNGLSVSGTANATTSINVGANVNLSTSAINVGNSTVNTTVTSSVVTTSNVVATNLSGNGASVTSVDAATVGGNTALTLRTYSETKAGDAYSNAVAYSGNAVQAYSNATAFAANADNIASGTLNTARLPATVNVATAVNVGANVNLTTAAINIGNSTVNTTVNSSVVSTGNVVATNLSGNGAAITTINADSISSGTLDTARLPATVNLSTAINVGANVSINTTTIFIGNSTVNTTIQAGNINLQGTQLTVGAVTIADNAYSIGNASINSTAIAVGANVITNTSALFIGNSTVNSVLTSTSLDIDGAINVGNATITGDLVVSGNVFFNGTTTNVNSTNLVVEDKNIIIGDVAVPTDVTADGGGITLKGATDKTLNWIDSTDAWTSSEDFNLVTGKQYEINGVQVVNSTALGSGVTGSSLTSVGTLTGLTVSGAASLQNTLAAGNTTVTGFVNVSSTANVGGNATLRGDVTVNGALTVANTAALGNTSVTGFVNASVGVNSALITVGTALVGNTTGLYHTGTVNAASHTTTGVTANVTGVYPASNSSGTALGAAANRWILNANTVDASGLATLSGGMNTTTANASVGVNVGANVNLTTTNINVGNSTVNTDITSGGIDTDGTLAVLGAATLSNTLAAGNTTVTGFVNASVSVNTALITVGTSLVGNTTGLYHTGTINAASHTTTGVTANVTGVYPASNSTGTALGAAANRWILNANTVDASGLATLSGGMNTTTANASVGVNVGANVNLTTTSINVGNSTVNTAITSGGIDTDGSLGVLGAATLSSTLAAGNTTVTGFVNVSSTANVGGNATLRGDVTVNGALTVSNTAALGNTTITGWANLTGNIAANNITARGNLTIDGDLTVSGNSVTLNSINLKITDNMIFLNEPELVTITGASSNGTHFLYVANNGYTTAMTVTVTGVTPSGYNVTGAAITLANSTHFAVANTSSPGAYSSGGIAEGRSSANPDLGFTGEYDDGTVRHAGVFRDATDSYWKVFDNYTPEPNGSFIDTANNTFRIANFQANNLLAATANVIGVLAAGNTTVTGFVNASVSVNSALITVGTNLIGNTTGLYHTGTVNAASVTVGASLVGNSSGLYHTGTVNAASHTTTGVTANVTGVYPASNSTGTALGAAANRWLLNANTINASGLITGTSGLDITGTANVSTAINVGANLTINTSTISIGNSTVNTFIQAGNIALRGTQLTVGNTTFDGDFLTVGNSTVNVFANSSTLKVGANVIANATALFIGNSTVNSVLTQSSLAIVGTVNATVSVNSAAFTVGTSFIANSSHTVTPSGLVVRGGTAAAEGGQITLGYGNNLATAITGQANNTWNIDVIGGNTGSTPMFRVFAQHNDGTTGNGLAIANTGRVHIGSLTENTDSTLKVTGSANVTTSLQIGTSLIANGATGTADQLLYANSTGGVYWRTPATITNVEPSNVGATSNGHVWYVYI